MPDKKALSALLESLVSRTAIWENAKIRSDEVNRLIAAWLEKKG